MARPSETAQVDIGPDEIAKSNSCSNGSHMNDVSLCHSDLPMSLAISEDGCVNRVYVEGFLSTFSVQAITERNRKHLYDMPNKNSSKIKQKFEGT